MTRDVAAWSRSHGPPKHNDSIIFEAEAPFRFVHQDMLVHESSVSGDPLGRA